MKKRFCLLLMCTFLPFPAHAEELLRTLSPAAAGGDDSLRAGEIVDGDTLRVTADPGRPLQLLIELSDPGITSPVYALKGMVRYQDVEGTAHLQLDNDFGEKGTFFSKTLAPAGPLGMLSGSSEWRAFILPFYANVGDQVRPGTTLTPEKLSFSLYLPGAGTVFIRDLGLYQYASGEDPLRIGGQWIGSRTLILLVAIGGGAIGLWGALVGALASRGKARGFAIGSATVLIVLGFVSLACGIAALATGQQYAVYYPLLLFGVIVIFAIGSLRRALPKRYEAFELKKMQALDI